MKKNRILKIIFMVVYTIIIVIVVAFFCNLINQNRKYQLISYMDYNQQPMQISYWHKETSYPVPISLSLDKGVLIQSFKDTTVETLFTIETKNMAQFIIEYTSSQGFTMQLIVYENHCIMLTTLNQSVPYRQYFKDESSLVFNTIKELINRQE